MTFSSDLFGKKIAIALSKLTSIDLRQYRLRVTVMDGNGNIFKDKYSISLTDNGRINRDSLAKDRTLFIYLWRNDEFVSYCETDSGNPTNFYHGSDHSIEFDGDKDYGLYLGNPSGGATKVDSSVKS